MEEFACSTLAKYSSRKPVTAAWIFESETFFSSPDVCTEPVILTAVNSVGPECGFPPELNETVAAPSSPAPIAFPRNSNLNESSGLTSDNRTSTFTVGRRKPIEILIDTRS